jgi:hypothetical protein
MTVRRTLARRLAAVAAAGAAVLSLDVSPAGALPVLESGDAAELARALADATEDQDVCYGWKVEISDYGGANDGIDEGSSLGVGPTAITTECPRWVIFEADILYTSSLSESEDQASFSVQSNVAGAPTSADLFENGIRQSGLLGDKDDQVVAEATLLLPALMAEKGLAEPIRLEANTQALPAGDKATGTPGSDWLRQYGAVLAVAVITLVGGLGWAAWVFFREHPFAPASVHTMSRRKRSGGLSD